ncbi:MAG: hypothetical protein KGJ35_00145 [Patescibacteria group bacterium]|nr:hypothetical protein [Patescibacteria group bacterium]
MNIKNFTLKGAGLPEELKVKWKKLFGRKPWVTSKLSDLCILADITDYNLALPKMTEDDARKLTELVKIHENINFADDFETGGKKQKASHAAMDRLLRQIIARK